MMGWRPAVIMAAAVPLCMITSIFDRELPRRRARAVLDRVADHRARHAGRQRDRGVRQRAAEDPAESEDQGAGEPAKTAAVIDGRVGSGDADPHLDGSRPSRAFVPMLTIIGGTGEYTRSLPVVVAMTLAHQLPRGDDGHPDHVPVAAEAQPSGVGSATSTSDRASLCRPRSGRRSGSEEEGSLRRRLPTAPAQLRKTRAAAASTTS